MRMHYVTVPVSDGAQAEREAHGLNRVTLIGNLGREPELRYTHSGTPVMSMRLATTESFKKGRGPAQLLAGIRSRAASAASRLDTAGCYWSAEVRETSSATMTKAQQRPKSPEAFAVAVVCSLLCELGCTTDGSAGSPDGSTDATDWSRIAEESGFPADPGGDFFAFSQSSCSALLRDTPTSIAQVAEMSSQVVLARVVGVVAHPEMELGCSACYDYAVQFELEVERTVKGPELTRLFVNDHCSGGSKVAGLMNTIPAERFLFLLDGPWPFHNNGEEPPPPPGVEFGHGLAGVWYSVVKEVDGSLRFAYPAAASSSRAFLGEYASLDALADAMEGW